MLGQMILLKPETTEAEIFAFTEPVELETVKDALDGGWLDQIPNFNQIWYEGIWRDCIAFFDEEGKQKNLPVNRQATARWYTYQITQNIRPADVLLGPVAVFIGDPEFLESF